MPGCQLHFTIASKLTNRSSPKGISSYCGQSNSLFLRETSRNCMSLWNYVNTLGFSIDAALNVTLTAQWIILPEKPNPRQIASNNLNTYARKPPSRLEDTISVPEERMMILHCRTCGKPFDSTFAVNDFAALSSEQLKAGTIHLCPHCGELAIYQLRDYQEPTNWNRFPVITATLDCETSMETFMILALNLEIEKSWWLRTFQQSDVLNQVCQSKLLNTYK